MFLIALMVLILLLLVWWPQKPPRAPDVLETFDGMDCIKTPHVTLAPYAPVPMKPSYLLRRAMMDVQ